MSNPTPPMEPAQPGALMEEELASQPDTWERAAALSTEQGLLPRTGERVAVIGCGTSWFMAQSYATAREAGGRGVTDAFAASESFLTRGYDAVVAISRSGTTTEVLEAVETVRGSTRVVGIVGDAGSPFIDLVHDAIALPFADERSVVQTRFATTALALLRASLGEDLTKAVADARRLLDEELDAELIEAGQHTFLGTGWTVGLAHEAALKLRESAQAWTESYPAKEFRHGPIAISGPGRVVWQLGPAPDGLAADVHAVGAHFEHRPDVDPMADLVRLHRVALACARRRGLDADAPRNLTRSVILG